MRFCRSFARGWLVHADPRSGLLPRNLTGDAYWNAKDSAADNYPFIVLTAHVLDDTYLKEAARTILERETKLTSRLDSLPDDFLFATQAFRTPEPSLEGIIFGAAEYAKDGLMPITEWLGPSPWLDRMKGLVGDVFKRAAIATPSGPIPSDDVEVAGDLLQVTSRLYWMTGDGQYAEWAFRLADRFLVHGDLLDRDLLVLRDHGSEIIGGLSEACVLAYREDPRRWATYRPRFRAVLDRVLEVGRNADGLLVNSVDPKTGADRSTRGGRHLGLRFQRFYAVVISIPGGRYREAAAGPCAAVAKYRTTTGRGAARRRGRLDRGRHQAVQPARLPNESRASSTGWKATTRSDSLSQAARRRRHRGLARRRQLRPDGPHVRLWKTQGDDRGALAGGRALGAVRGDDGSLLVSLGRKAVGARLLSTGRGTRTYMHLPIDYPRINQFPGVVHGRPSGPLRGPHR